MTTSPKRGRRPIYTTREERDAAKRAAKLQWKNISLDAELVEALNKVADDLQSRLGFRPTLSQAVRYLINQHQTGV